jgi:hypothetical protein
MDEPILDRIPRLERSVRFWRNTSLILAALLLSILVTGFGFLAIAHQRTARAMDDAMRAKMIAVEEAELVRMQAVRALEEAKQKQRRE